MTTSGFADWQRLSAVVGTEIDVWDAVLSGSTTSDVYTVGHTGYVNVTVDAIGLNDRYSITMIWLSDAAGTSTGITQRFTAMPGGQNAVQLPVISPWVKLEITNNDDTDTGAIAVAFFGTTARAPYLMNAEQNAPFLYIAGDIASTANITDYPGQVYAGPVTWSVAASGAGAWHAVISYYDVGLVGWQALYAIHSATAGQSAQMTVRLPPVPVRMTVVNDSTGTMTFQAALVIGDGS